MSYQGTKINPKSFHYSQLKFYLILIPMSLFMLLPIVFIFNNALKPLDEILRFPPTFIAQRPTFRNFRVIWSLASQTSVPITRYIINSLLITGMTVLLSVFITASSAFALSKKKFRAKEWLMKINQLALMFIPVAVTVPRYLVVKEIGLMNQFAVHILPMLAMPVGLFLVKQFVDQIPDSLLEAARIDGAREHQVLFKVVFPLIGPALATVGILSFQTVWNATEASTYFIVNDAIKSFAFYLNTFTIGNQPSMAGVSAAASLILFVPNLVIFIAMQSRVMNTMSHSGIK